MAVSLFGLIVAVFVAGSLVHKEVEKRTVFVLFSKPVGRSEFIWGKFLGLAATMLIVLAGMALFLFAIAWLVTRPVGSVLLATLLVFLQLLAVMAITILFSTLTSAILASVLGDLRVRRRSAESQCPVAHTSATARCESRLGGLLLVPNLSAIDIKGPVAGEGTSGVPSGRGPATSPPTSSSCCSWRPRLPAQGVLGHARVRSLSSPGRRVRGSGDRFSVHAGATKETRTCSYPRHASTRSLQRLGIGVRRLLAVRPSSTTASM